MHKLVMLHRDRYQMDILTSDIYELHDDMPNNLNKLIIMLVVQLMVILDTK